MLSKCYLLALSVSVAFICINFVSIRQFCTSLRRFLGGGVLQYSKTFFFKYLEFLSSCFVCKSKLNVETAHKKNLHQLYQNILIKACGTLLHLMCLFVCYNVKGCGNSDASELISLTSMYIEYKKIVLYCHMLILLCSRSDFLAFNAGKFMFHCI